MYKEFLNHLFIISNPYEMEIHVNLHLILYVGGVTLTKREVSLHAGEWMKKKSF